MATPESDVDVLVQAAREGNREAFASLCMALIPVVARYVTPRAPRSDVDDVIQTVLVRFIDNFPTTKFQDFQHAVAYVRTIARNHLNDQARRRHHSPSALLPGIDVTDPHPFNEVALDMDAYLAILTPREREVIERLFQQQQSIEDAGAEMGITPNAVRKTLHRALDHLRKAFGDSEFEQK